MWSLRNANISPPDSFLTAIASERAQLLATGAWSEVCASISNPTAICVDTQDKDGRAGPFLLFNSPAVEDFRFIGAPAAASVAL